MSCSSSSVVQHGHSAGMITTESHSRTCSKMKTDRHNEVFESNGTVNYGEFACGWGAAFINIMSTYVLNKIMFRQQLHGISMAVAVQQLRNEGVTHLYRGVLPPLLQKTTSLMIMFGGYDQYKRMIHHTAPQNPLVLTKAAAAMLAGTTEAVLTPFERVQTLLQAKNTPKSFKNTFHAFRGLQQHGMSEYFRGLSPILLRNGPSNVIFFLLRGKARDVLPDAKTTAGVLACDFVSGAVLGAIISTMFYPVNVVKTRMQAKVGSRTTARQVFVTIMRERNHSIKALFSGVHMNYIRALVSWGIINASYEFLHQYL